MSGVLAGSVVSAGLVVVSDRSESEVLVDFPWLGGVNPYRDGGVGGVESGPVGGLIENCVMTAIATDMSLRDGWGYQAGGADPLPTRHLVNYQRQQLGLADDAPGVVFDVADFGVVRGLLAGAGVGARGVVVVQSSVSEVSHAFNVVRDVRGVTFLDGQAGRLAVAPGSVVAVKFLPMTVGLVAPAGVRVSDGSELVGLTGADP
ncbi:toxin glutamine deamidase domain-containing protein, partial [Dactylosporangium darangshiense]|uniref:toxin glutamine deamidase domain-containing protein n=1 Tax=Dactylosporangium darangshiense TaxID=579108 RepID=UPI0031EF98F1